MWLSNVKVSLHTIHSVMIHLPVKAAFSRSQRNRQTVTLGLLLEELDIHKLNMLGSFVIAKLVWNWNKNLEIK